MKNIEIPLEKDRKGWYRAFEIMPAVLSWTMLALPFILSTISVTLATVFVFGFIIIYLVRGVGLTIRALQGYHTLRTHQRYDWWAMARELQQGVVDSSATRPAWHRRNVKFFHTERKLNVQPSEVLHAIIIATYNESREVLEPTIKSILASNYDISRVMLIIAYEARGGAATAEQANDLIGEYKAQFFDAIPVQHPKDIPGEIVGKGGNITYAGRQLQRYLEDRSISPDNVIVTTLDADNHPDKNYLAAVSYVYAICPDPLRASLQPTAMYNKNIWDVPAPMRVIATGNTFFHMAGSLRPHLLRNFSAHAQGMRSLIETDFWSVRTVVEDGHHFWRSYFRFDGKYQVLPIYVPVYQDAVLSSTYVKTLKAQFVQIRRWTYGASDIAYVLHKGFFEKNKVPKFDLFTKSFRLIEGHVTWAAGALVSLYAGFVPALFHNQSIAASELPLIVSQMQRVALVGIFALVFICFKTLPPKPERYKRHRNILMIIQWVYMPVTSIVYNSCAALYSQTRLALGKYFGTFDVTDKAVKK